MSDTPETDALWKAHSGFTPILASEAIAMCGRLERERNHLADALRKLSTTYALAYPTVDELDRIVCHIAKTALAELERSKK